MATSTVVPTPVFILAYSGFVSLGLPDSLIGVAWPAIRSGYGVPTASVGLLLFASTAGYVLSSVAAGFTIARLGVGWLVAGSTATMSLAMAGYVVSPSLTVLALCTLVAGFGGGAMAAGLNSYAADTFGPRHMNWLHAFFGLGMALGPVIMAGVVLAALSWRWAYGIVALAQSGLALAFVITAPKWNEHRPGAPTGNPHQAPVGTHHAPVGIGVALRTRDTLTLPAVWLGVLAFATYRAIEMSTGLWAFLLLTDARGFGAVLADVCVAGYWASLFLGRLVQGVVAERLGSPRVLVAGLVGMAGAALLVALPWPAWLAVCGLILIGFSAAPVFPLLTLATADRVGAAHADRAIGMQIAGAALGGALVPAAIGVLISSTNAEILGAALLTLSLLLLMTFAAGRRYQRRHPEMAR